MIRTLELTADQKLTRGDSLDQVRPPAEGTLLWVDVDSPDEATLALLGQRFGFHTLALEDCAHRDQRPKAEEYGDHLFIVTQGFACPGDDLQELHWHELHAFLGTNYLVTVHDGSIPAIEQVWKRVQNEPAAIGRGLDFVYYLLVDKLVDDNFPILDLIADVLEEIQEQVLLQPRPEELARIFSLKKKLVMMRKVLSPQRDVLAILSKRGDPRISEKTAVYLRDVYDHLARTVESAEANRDLLGNALEAYLSSSSQRTNEIMKTLAILSAVFMPLTFITGYFGQNFDHLPIHSYAVYTGMMVSLVGTPVALLLWFKSRRWF